MTGKKVLVVDEQSVFAEMLDLSLTRCGHQSVAAALPRTENQVKSLLAQVRRTKPAAVLLSLTQLTYRDGVRLIRPLAETGVPVVVLTDHLDDARYGQCLAAGARQVIGQRQRLADLLSTLRRLGENQTVLDVVRREELIGAWCQHRVASQDVQQRLESLTVREAEVLTDLMHGRTTAEIAKRNLTTMNTVRTQVCKVLHKLDVPSQHAAVSVAYRMNWRTDLASVA